MISSYGLLLSSSPATEMRINLSTIYLKGDMIPKNLTNQVPVLRFTWSPQPKTVTELKAMTTMAAELMS